MSRKTIKSFTSFQAYLSGKKALVETIAGGSGRRTIYSLL